nr:hypothetical protein [Burkholderia cepacia]
MGPAHATRKALARAGLRIEGMDVIEINEAFASQAIACMRELGTHPDRTNIDGGAIALGHPLGARNRRTDHGQGSDATAPCQWSLRTCHAVYRWRTRDRDCSRSVVVSARRVGRRNHWEGGNRDLSNRVECRPVHG